MARVVTFAHQKGGVGKSTLALNLALAFQHHLSVAVVDLDPQGSLMDLKDELTGIAVLSAPKNLNQVAQLPYDLVCIDTPPYLTEHLTSAFLASDAVLIPTKAGVFDVLAIRRTVDYVSQAQAQKPALRAGIVLNMIKPGTSLTEDARQVLAGYGLPLLQTSLSDRVSYARSPLMGGVFGSDDTKAKDEITALASELLTLLEL